MAELVIPTPNEQRALNALQVNVPAITQTFLFSLPPATPAGGRVKDWLIINDGSYTIEERRNNELVSQTIDYQGIAIQSCLFAIALPKNIVRTSIAGRDGDVIQYIGLGSAEVSIVGTVGAETQEQLMDFLTLFDALMKVPAPLTFSNDFLISHNITELIITDYRVSQKQGFPTLVDFQISAIKETILELSRVNT